jgi:hypothetical protein
LAHTFSRRPERRLCHSSAPSTVDHQWCPHCLHLGTCKITDLQSPSIQPVCVCLLCLRRFQMTAVVVSSSTSVISSGPAIIKATNRRCPRRFHVHQDRIVGLSINGILSGILCWTLNHHHNRYSSNLVRWCALSIPSPHFLFPMSCVSIWHACPLLPG